MNSSGKSGFLTVEFVPPDTLVVHYVGAVDGDMVRQARLNSRHFIEGCDQYVIVFDVRRLESISHDGRQAIVAPPPGGTPPARAVAVVGASFHTRAIVSMITRAWKFLNRQNDRPVRFFETMEAAHEWLASRRPQELV
jgi:hypothetical protein